MARTRAVDWRGPWRPEAERPPECRGCGRALARLRRRGGSLAGCCANPACGERVGFRFVERRWVVAWRERA